MSESEYADAMREQTEALRELNREVKALNAKLSLARGRVLGKSVNHAAAAGKRKAL